MKKETIQQYMQRTGTRQTAMAELLGMKQGSLSQLLRSGRKVFVLMNDEAPARVVEERELWTSEAS